ncbi:MAG: Alpha-D-ribose 1-methylphosphonate 5-triphosphate synthase subunit PhnH [Pseudomonas fluorescens]|nr:MAG: Alpha-D-ribose 1-methylphosphonate 5-triphosphate synthase subunit PhnH [Pseudomonas fluorescens]
MNAHLLQPAFVDPVLDAQRGFRAALKALAEPGLIRSLSAAPTLEGLAPATYALCLALLDVDTPLWLAPSFDTPLIRANLAFHCGCPLVERREDAHLRCWARQICSTLAASTTATTATRISPAPCSCN